MSEELGFEVELLTEGRVRFYAPKIPPEPGFAPSELPAFFNPASKPSRDMAVLFLRSWFNRKVTICEPLAGTGVRTLRLIVESGVVEKASANDISVNAYKLIKKNAELNGLQDKVEAYNLDANEFLASRGRGRPRYDYVDVDPAGTPVPYMENGFRGCGKNSVLGATATDLSALTGAKPKPCWRKYDAWPLRAGPFRMEVALRILAGFMARTAARIGLAARPILSFRKDHYVRVFVGVERGKEKAKQVLGELGWMSHCGKCLATYSERLWNPPPSSCPRCGEVLEYAGPLWLGTLTRGEIASKMLEHALSDEEVYGDVIPMLRLMSQEDTGIPGYYPVNYIASRLKKSPVKPGKLIEELRSMGYRATPTHLDPGAVKTDAEPEDLKNAFEAASRND